MRKVRLSIRVLFVVAVLIVLWLTVSFSMGSVARGNHTLRVMTWNTHLMDGSHPAADNRVLDYVLHSGADVVCLQEVELRRDSRHLTLAGLKEFVAREYPYTYFDFKVYNNRRQYGNVVLSRYPLVDKQTVRYDSRSNISSRCDVLVDGDTLRLICNHLESNRLVASDWVDSITSAEIRQSAELISGKMRYAGHLRRGQARVVRHEVDESPYPVLLVGDFNSTPLSAVYLRLRFGLKQCLSDCFLAGSRFNLGNTFDYHHIGVRIDYILVSRCLRTLRCSVDRETKISDHQPVIATVTW